MKTLRIELDNGEVLLLDIVEEPLVSQLFCCVSCRRFLQLREAEEKVLGELTESNSSQECFCTAEGLQSAMELQESSRPGKISSNQISSDSELSFHGSEAPNRRIELPSAVRSPALKKVQGIKFLSQSGSQRSNSIQKHLEDDIPGPLQSQNTDTFLLTSPYVQKSPQNEPKSDEIPPILSPSSRVTRSQFQELLKKIPKSPSFNPEQMRPSSASSRRGSGLINSQQQEKPLQTSSFCLKDSSVQCQLERETPVGQGQDIQEINTSRAAIRRDQSPIRMNFSQVVERLQTPFMAYKYMVGRKKFHEVKVFLPLEVTTTFVPVCWCKPSVHVDPNGMSLGAWSDRNYIDVVVCANNAGQLPFSREVEKAMKKLPFDCQNENVFVLYSKRRPWICVVLAMEICGGFAQAMTLLTQTVLQATQATADSSVNKSMRAMSLSTRPSRKQPTVSGLEEFEDSDVSMPSESLHKSVGQKKPGVKSRLSTTNIKRSDIGKQDLSITSSRHENTFSNDQDYGELVETKAERRERERIEKVQAKELQRQANQLEKEKNKSEKAQRKLEEQLLKESRKLEKEQARLKDLSSVAPTSSTQQSEFEEEYESQQYVYEETQE